MTMARQIALLGAPLEFGASQRGPLMGPAALRTAQLAEVLTALGHSVDDYGDAIPDHLGTLRSGKQQMRNMQLASAWTCGLKQQACKLVHEGYTPIFLGGDHSMSLGTIAGIAEYAREVERELFVLWLDAHPDFNTPQTSPSGNLHGTPVAFLCGLSGFDFLLGAPLATPVRPQNICMMGIRSVDPQERDLLVEYGVIVHDMRRIDENGIARLLRPFLKQIAERNGLLHVSLDVDFLDPEIAPGVGTTVPGGATFREAHLIMELLHDSNLVTSLDLAELNPFLDERGRTACLMVDLVASLFGRRTMDRQTKTRW